MIAIWGEFGELFFVVGDFEFGIYGWMNGWVTLFVGHDSGVLFEFEEFPEDIFLMVDGWWLYQYGSVVDFEEDMARRRVWGEWDSGASWDLLGDLVLH